MAKVTAAFSCDARSARLARQFVRDELGDRHVDVAAVDTAVLLANELFTNAVLHARTDIAICCDVHKHWLRVEVADGNSRPPVAATPPLDATSGRGLSLVDSLSESWGVDRTHTGKTVWFELAH